MTRNEMASWIQVAIGVVGLAFALIGGAPVIGDAAQKGAELGPRAVASLIGFAFIIVFSAGLIAVGTGFLLVSLFKRLGARFPHHAAFSFVGSLLAFTASLVLSLLGNPFWITTTAVGLVGLIGAIIAAGSEDSDAFWLVTLAATVMSVLMSVAIVSTTLN